MNFLTGITNLTDWMGNVIMPTLAALFFALGVLRFAHGQAHTSPWAGFLCLMVSGVLRGIERFAAQAAWNNPDFVWITLRGLVNWTCNVFLPVYAVLQLVHGFMQYSGFGHRIYAGGAWMRHLRRRTFVWRCQAYSGWPNGSSRRARRHQLEEGQSNVMALTISPVHRNLHTRVRFLYLEFEDWFVVIGLAALTNIFGRWVRP